ncbi:purine-cytosine permease [Scheffersomyces spartinae]|uniref:Purine-cytosine permease n=1 Tax=Scheffersomyces spartinae TaxID=45513 RepID=A0A9P7V9Q5_9ASCO|nr:purine-cytosine permease [Scheffersomyces spartinae]KAG7193433.1 purine-cytosine permease [Scheffersomyces spartinae]
MNYLNIRFLNHSLCVLYCLSDLVDFAMTAYEKEVIVTDAKKESDGSLDLENDDNYYGVVEEDSKKLGIVDKWAQKLNAETKGIERISDDERTQASVFAAGSMWLSANLVIATFSLGTLGITVFGLSFWQCVLVILSFSFMGAFSVAFFSCFGPKFGLRQMLLSRYFVGNFTCRIFSLINMIACVGWGAVNIMAAAQLLHIVNNGALPPWVGCIILVALTIIVTFFGYHVIHIYEKWSWVPNAICFIAIIARMAKSKTFTYGTTVGGVTTAGNVLSFGGAVYGYATGWTTFAADYTVYQPKSYPTWKIFFGVLGGLMFPLCFTMILGAACATGTLTNERWNELYSKNAVGGLVYAVLVEESLHGFGQFLCVLLALSTVANNIPNMYSIALSAQSVWNPLIKVPRIVWTIAGNLVTLAICIPAYYEFEDVMHNFMNLIAYYLGIYQAISYSEHFIYRKGKFANYDYMNYLDPKSYAAGYAGTFAFFVGIAGCVLGMNQVWYQGVIGKKIGDYGGDIGFEMGLGFAFIAYNIARPLELKYVGR